MATTAAMLRLLWRCNEEVQEVVHFHLRVPEKSRGRESGRIPFRHAYSWRDVVLQETHIPHPQPARTPQSPSALINGN